MSDDDDQPAQGAVGRLRRKLGVTEISAWTHEVNRQLEELTAARHVDGHRLRLLERELEVWRFMAWLGRARPASDCLVSVVTPTHNRAEELRHSIASVLAQAHGAFELLVVDDGGTDAAAATVGSFDDPRVVYLRTEHAGACAARNNALAHARGDIVTYLDDDNRMDPLWLMAVVWAFGRRPAQRMLYGARLIDDEDAVHGRRPGGLPMLHFARFDRGDLEQGNIADTNVIAHRRDDPEAHFDESLSVFGDWDLLLRLTRDAVPYELPAIACAYSTQAPERLTGHDADAERDERDRVLAKHRATGP